MVAAVAAMLLMGSLGCGGACDDAASLCEECELEQVADECQSRYDEASTQYCEDAVETYETSCPAAE